MKVENSSKKERIINSLRILEGHPAILNLKYILGDDIYVTRIRGPTLEDYLSDDQHRPLDFQTVLDFSLRMVDAVAWCHQHGIVHSDIADRNFLVNSQAKIYLIDFGNSRRYTDKVQDTVIPGATAFACPEHDLGIDIGFAADVFALGGVFYKLISGVGPFDHARKTEPSLSEAENWTQNRARVLEAKLHRNFKPLTEFNTAFYDGEMFGIIEGILNNHQDEKNRTDNLLLWFKERERLENLRKDPPRIMIQPASKTKYVRDWSGSELYAEDVRKDGNPLDLSHTDLTNATLRGDFSGFIFNHSTLRNADLRDVNLAHAWLLGVDARDADFRGVQAQYANLSLSDISGSEVGDMRLDCAFLHASTAKDLAIDEGERLYIFTDKHRGLHFGVQSDNMIDRLEGIDASPQIMSEVISQKNGHRYYANLDHYECLRIWKIELLQWIK